MDSIESDTSSSTSVNEIEDEDDICVYTGNRVYKIRWRPGEFISDFFVTGSWSEQDNVIQLWQLPNPAAGTFDEPEEVASIDVLGDVTQLKFLNSDKFLASTNEGSVELFHINQNDDIYDIKNQASWHNHMDPKTEQPVPCTDFALYEERIVSVGENGSVVMFDVNAKIQQQFVETDWWCIIRCVSYFDKHTIVTGNMRGELKTYDTRKTGIPELTFSLEGSIDGCIEAVHHPKHKEVLVVAMDSGSIVIWDIRNTKTYSSVLPAHKSIIREIGFDLQQHNNFFSCASNGELHRWTAPPRSIDELSALSTNKEVRANDEIEENVWPWLCPEISGKLTLSPLISNYPMSINSFDVKDNILCCGCDNTAVHLIKLI